MNKDWSGIVRADRVILTPRGWSGSSDGTVNPAANPIHHLIIQGAAYAQITVHHQLVNGYTCP